MVRLGHSTPHAALLYQHADHDRDDLMTARMSELHQHTGTVVPFPGTGTA